MSMPAALRVDVFAGCTAHRRPRRTVQTRPHRKLGTFKITSLPAALRIDDLAGCMAHRRPRRQHRASTSLPAARHIEVYAARRIDVHAGSAAH
jgi:hypothetical protein